MAFVFLVLIDSFDLGPQPRILFLLCNWSESHSVLSDSLWPQRLHCPWNSAGQNIGVGSHFVLQGIFPTQGLNPGLLHRRQILYQLSHQGSPWYNPWVREILWRRKWQPTTVILPGKSCGWRSLLGYSSWGCKESYRKDWLHFHFHFKWSHTK